MNVIEALVINATGWRDHQKEQWDEAQATLLQARAELNRKRLLLTPIDPVQWVPETKD